MLSNSNRRTLIHCFIFPIILLMFWHCELDDESSIGLQVFSIKQLHGRESDLINFPALHDYDAEPSNKIIVDMVTSEHLNIDYSGMFLRSFATPAIFFADISTCATSNSL